MPGYSSANSALSRASRVFIESEFRSSKLKLESLKRPIFGTCGSGNPCPDCDPRHPISSSPT
jgi:hypothetical protein